MLTIPRSLFKSYTKDLSLPIFELVSVSPGLSLMKDREPQQCYDLGHKRVPMRIHDNIREGYISPLSSMDSGLEAFSRNPTHDSFSPLAVQLSENTKYVNQRFLSY